ncbi:MAG: hypothetical protein UZ21_OP11001000040 [Microgenomates bacterium OLB22]|nr:MAG: hypothetical protein UZ21_OP11001000040 [Microgenomates bacterium OLB22]
MEATQEKSASKTLEVTHLNIRESIVILFIRLFLIELLFMGILSLGCLPGNCLLAPLFSNSDLAEQSLFFYSKPRGGNSHIYRDLPMGV